MTGPLVPVRADPKPVPAPVTTPSHGGKERGAVGRSAGARRRDCKPHTVAKAAIANSSADAGNALTASDPAMAAGIAPTQSQNAMDQSMVVDRANRHVPAAPAMAKPAIAIGTASCTGIAKT